MKKAIKGDDLKTVLDKSALKVEQIPIDRLIPNERNPRINDKAVEAVARSIQAYGFNNPIITDGDLNIAAGHTRLKAAIKLGLTTVPVIRIPGLTGSKFTGFAIADNKTADIADWNEPLLGELLWELNQDTDFDLSSLGFGDSELTSILDDFMSDDGLTDPDDVPDTPKVAKTKLGDLYQLGDHRLLCGDATKKDDVERLLDSAVPFMMVTDPPYGVNYDPDWRNKAAEAGSIGYGARAIGRVQNDDCADWTAAYLLFDGDIAYTWSPGGDHVLITGAAVHSAGFEIRSMIIWRKARFAISRGAYHYQHEPCWYAVRKGAKANWCGDRSQSTVWDIGHCKNETGHSTQKPVECMSRPIRNHGKEGDSIYDPFLGSGTTMIACEQLNRKCYGMEIDPLYCDVIVGRWEKFSGGKAKLISE